MAASHAIFRPWVFSPLITEIMLCSPGRGVLYYVSEVCFILLDAGKALNSVCSLTAFRQVTCCCSFRWASYRTCRGIRKTAGCSCAMLGSSQGLRLLSSGILQHLRGRLPSLRITAACLRLVLRTSSAPTTHMLLTITRVCHPHLPAAIAAGPHLMAAQFCRLRLGAGLAALPSTTLLPSCALHPQAWQALVEPLQQLAGLAHTLAADVATALTAARLAGGRPLRPQVDAEVLCRLDHVQDSTWAESLHMTGMNCLSCLLVHLSLMGPGN